jgi:hypothetical protein
VPGNSYALESLETTFNQDLNGDSVIGLYARPGTVLQISSPTNAGSATIGTGAALEIVDTYSGSVTFATSTGMLQLDSPSTFNGEIFNFTGNGSLSGSDQIDLKGINYNSVQDSYANGVLNVTEGFDSANLNFNGSYTLANFSLANDGSGGTTVYDPSSSTARNTDVARPAPRGAGSLRPMWKANSPSLAPTTILLRPLPQSKRPPAR